MSHSPASLPKTVIRIALVEDDEPVREILCEWIRETPDFVLLGAYPDAEQAMEGLAAQPPDVALLDINLPGLSGIDCVRRLKAPCPQTQFVMLTVYEDSAHIFEALEAGASGYLQKRTSKAALIEALRDVHGGGSPLTSSIARLIVQSFQRPEPRNAATEGLSKREHEVLALIAQGYLYKEVADRIGISLPTVKTYIRRICEKLHVRSRSQAVALYAQLPIRSDR